eukprot:SAG31_NODE_420_length_15868_cov_11.896823_6_plen_75_part_00
MSVTPHLLQVLKKAGATTLEEIRALPAANISDWPDSAYIGNQLFPGCFIDGCISIIVACKSPTAEEAVNILAWL